MSTLYLWEMELRHDSGLVRLQVPARSFDDAVRLVRAVEGCPARSCVAGRVVRVLAEFVTC